MAELTSFPILFMIILTFGFHVVMLAIEIILALIIPLMRYLGRQPHRVFENKIAKRYMQYIAISY